VFYANVEFDWFYVRFLRPLIAALGARAPLLSHIVLMLSGGKEVFAFEDGAFRQIPGEARGDRHAVLDVLGAGSKQRVAGMPVLDPAHTVYIGDSIAGGIDRALASSVEFVIDVGDAIPDTAGQPLSGLHRRYRRTIDAIVTMTAAMRDSGRSVVPASGTSEVGDTTEWTFEQARFPRHGRVHVRVGGSGFVHAGVEGTDGRWTRVYNVPLVPLPEGGYEALLPAGVSVFTFFWTEPPWRHGRPGHWERGPAGTRLFRAERE
jgi:hypothetical protein